MGTQSAYFQFIPHYLKWSSGPRKKKSQVITTMKKKMLVTSIFRSYEILSLFTFFWLTCIEWYTYCMRSRDRVLFQPGQLTFDLVRVMKPVITDHIQDVYPYFRVHPDLRSSVFSLSPQWGKVYCQQPLLCVLVLPHFAHPIKLSRV